MSRSLYIAACVGAMALVTALLRFLPFLIFRGRRETPAAVRRFGEVLPYATIAMLVVFCLKDVRFSVRPWGLPEAISCAVVIALHAWKHHTLLSIIGGTACYMFLIQSVFA